MVYWFLKVFLRDVKAYILNLNNTKAEHESQEIMITLIDTLTGDIKITAHSLPLEKLLMLFCDINLTENNPLLSCYHILFGICYRDGFINPYGNDRVKALKCREKAITYFEQAIKLGNPLGYEVLGDTWYNTDNIWSRCDNVKAYQYYTAGAKANVIGCLVMLSHNYLYGILGFESNYAKYRQLLNQGVSRDYTPSKVTCASFALKPSYSNDVPRGNFTHETALEYLTSLSIKGTAHFSPEACVRLGQYYQFKSITKNTEHAKNTKDTQENNSQNLNDLKNIKDLKAQNDIKAQKDLNECLAEEYFELASSEDIDHLSTDLFKLKIKKMPFAEALKVFQDRPSSKIIEALVNGNEAIHLAAKRLINMAGKFSARIANFLGALFENGYYTERDHKRALAYYSLGAELGDIGCLLGQARCLLFGQDVENNPELGFEILSTIAYRKEDKAVYPWLARCYELGVGKRKSVINAIGFYNQVVFKRDYDILNTVYFLTRLSDIYRKTGFVPIRDLAIIKERYQYIANHNDMFAAPKAHLHLGEMALVDYETLLKKEKENEEKRKEEEKGKSQNSSTWLGRLQAILPTMTTKSKTAINIQGSDDCLSEKLKLATEAFNHFQSAEKSRSAYQARFRLCQMYHLGLGTSQDLKKSEELFHSLKRSADPTSNPCRMETIFYTGRCYEEGYGVAFNPTRALAMYDSFMERHQASQQRGHNKLYQYDEILEKTQKTKNELENSFMPRYKTLLQTFPLFVRAHITLIAEFAYERTSIGIPK